ncbi:retm, partial [Symbiodinium pilosum]
MEADEQVCIWVTAAAWLGVLGVLTICGADLLIFLAAFLRSILLLLLGGFLALCSASSLLLALGALLVTEPRGLGTAPGVFFLSGSVFAAFLGTTMALYQASKATPTRLHDEKPKWKEETEGLSEEEERARIQQALVECVDNLYDIPRLDRYRVSLRILEECNIQDLSYEEWIIEERLRMKTGKARRAVLTEDELKRATIELRIRRSPQEALKKVLERMLEEARKGRGAGRIPMDMLQDAFQEIDVTLRNRITTRELLAALKVCGIFMEGAAAEKLLWWFHREEESQDDGYLDIGQFVFLFNQVADMMAKETIMKKASRGYTITCQVSFLANLIFLSFVLFSVSQPSSDPSWDMLLNVFGSAFILQFWVVIGLPMLCSVIGTKAAVWKQHFLRQLLKCVRCVCRPILRLMSCTWAL